MQLRLGLWVLDVLADELEQERNVYPFELPNGGGPTNDDRRAHVDKAWAHLEERGFARGRRLNPDVEDLLLTWWKPQVMISMLAKDEHDLYKFRSGWFNSLGFHSQLEGDDVYFEGGKPFQVPDAIVSRLPAMPAFHAPAAVAYVADTPDDDDDDGLGLADDGDAVMPGVRSTEGNVRVYKDAEGFRAGFISVYKPDRRGMPEPVDRLTWVDTENGRYMLSEEPAGGGMVRKSFQPTNGDLIRWWINDRTNPPTDS